jgi:hypothetical protein
VFAYSRCYRRRTCCSPSAVASYREAIRNNRTGTINRPLCESFESLSASSRLPAFPWFPADRAAGFGPFSDIGASLEQAVYMAKAGSAVSGILGVVLRDSTGLGRD